MRNAMGRDRIEIRGRVMKRYLVSILIITVLVSVFLLGCNSVPLSVTAPSQESNSPTGSASPDYQQQINELEKQVQSLNQRVDALDRELEQKVGSLIQEVDSLEESINALEREVETLPSGTSSDIEARIEELGEQIDGLNAEVVTIKQRLAEQEVEEEETSSTAAPEAPAGTIFTFSGQGNSMSLPFTIGSSPFKIVLWSNLVRGGSTSVNIGFIDPTNYDPRLGGQEVGIGGFNIQGISTLETVIYVPAGTYFLSVNTHYATIWTVWVIELD